jgi:hypothetical protein
MAGKPVPIPQTFTNFTGSGRPGEIPVTGGTYNPITQTFTPTPVQGQNQTTPVVPQGGPPPEDPAVTAAKIAAKQRQDEIDELNRQRRQATEGAVKAAFALYGLSSLFPIIQKYAQQGLTEDEIYLNLRNTAEYKARFPAMEALSLKGRAITEAAYVDYETKAAQLEQQYGYPKGMVSGSITDLLVGDVSLAELNDRMILSAADSITAPADLKQQLKDYYNVDPDQALKAYYLDPDRALPILQMQSATARIGVQATRQGVSGIDRTLAEELQGLGVSEAAAQKGFGVVASQAGFTAGKGETTDNVDLTRGAFGNAESAAKTERIASGRVGAFQQGGGFAETNKGVAGLASAAG